MEKLIEAISRGQNLQDEVLEAVKENFTLVEASKNEKLLKEGQYCRRLYFLNKGIVRTFYYAKNKDVTSWFYREGQFFTAWYSFYVEQPSFEYIEVLEDCEFYAIDHYAYNTMLDTHFAFSKFGRKLAEDITAHVDHFSKGYMFLSAKERYELFITLFPTISQRVNLGYIASFLGISQETLSRIRNK